MSLFLVLGPFARAQGKAVATRTWLHSVRVGLDAAQPSNVTLDGGRIAAIEPESSAQPAGARVIEAQGKVLVPAFVDLFASSLCSTPVPVADQDVPVPLAANARIDMREALRKGIQPAFHAARALELAQDKLGPWRQNGFGAVNVAPTGQVLAGASALVAVRDAAARDLVLRPTVFQHAAFAATGAGYPSTLMGYTAQLRQFLLDARRQSQLEERAQRGAPGARPSFDADLDEAAQLLSGRVALACEADRASDIERWLGLAAEFELRTVLIGGREAWRVAPRLAERHVPVVLTLDWGEEPKDPHAEDAKKAEREAQGAAQAPDETKSAPAGADAAAPSGDAAPGGDAALAPKEGKAAASARAVYEEPLGVREERRRLWLEGRDCALRLHEAGVEFAFGSGSLSASELRKRVRTLVDAGLPKDAALAACTSRAATLAGEGRRLGRIEVGYDATLALWTADPFAKDSKLAWLFVDGFAHEFDLDQEPVDESPPDPGLSAAGVWELSIQGRGGVRTGRLELKMEPDGATRGTLTSPDPSGSERREDLEGRLAKHTLSLHGTSTRGSGEVEIWLKGEIVENALSGDMTVKGGFGEFRSELTGTRTPQRERATEGELR